MSCCQGDLGRVDHGAPPFVVDEQALQALPPPRDMTLINVGNPEAAFNLARIPCDGVGLARLEFIMANPIRSHPLALLCSERVSDPQVRQRIAALRRGYSQPQDY